MVVELNTPSMIKEARIRLRISQAALADALGCAHQFVSQWERGASFPPAHLAGPLADVLEIPPVALKRAIVGDILAVFKAKTSYRYGVKYEPPKSS